MIKLTIDLKKSVEENASIYFEKSKKIKKKIKGAEEALEHNRKKLKELEGRAERERQEIQKGEEVKTRKKEWYEKFRWFFSSEGFLIVGGRDATSNEIVIKKYTDVIDLVFHTDMAGSPFFVVKAEGNAIGKNTISEAADATVTFSRAWKLGLQTTSVFYVKPEQVSKKTKAGEYMGKGSFMIYGKVNYIENKLNLAIGIDNKNRVMSGPLEAVKKHCGKYIELRQGNKKPSDIAKMIKHKIGGELDEIIRSLPAGEFEVSK